jgi:glycosyltransferase involved in cell wall biosynthesis
VKAHRVYFRCKKALYRANGQGYQSDVEPRVLKNYAKQVTRRLEALSPDVVFSPGTLPISYLETDKPIVFWTDATFAGLLNFYPEFSNLCPETITHGNQMEQAALRRARLAIYSSDWAAQTAGKHYALGSAQLAVVPFGANVRSERTIETIGQLLRGRSTKNCNLLFIGKDWMRKGGDRAVAVAERLNELGLPTELRIVGALPRRGQTRLPSFVKAFGSIDKSSPDGLSSIENVIRDCHFLILPSRADASPIVLAEANSFGLPCLATKVGGIPTLITDDVNGRLFGNQESIDNYCKYILEVFADPRRYQELALSSFYEYRTRLNWASASSSVNKLLRQIQ